jgi:hypothetical protein
MFISENNGFVLGVAEAKDDSFKGVPERIVDEKSTVFSECNIEKMKVKQKRGRKPKGGKIKTKEPANDKDMKVVSNIILHLKCSTADLNHYILNANNFSLNMLEYNPNLPPEIMTYNDVINTNSNMCLFNIDIFSSQATENWSSPSLRSCESSHFSEWNVKNSDFETDAVNQSNSSSHVTSETPSATEVGHNMNFLHSIPKISGDEDVAESKMNFPANSFGRSENVHKGPNEGEHIFSSEELTVNFPSQATENWSSPSLRSGESLDGFLCEKTSIDENNFPTQATENWSSPSLRSGESLNFHSQTTENWSSPSLRSGESLNFHSQTTENWSSPSLRSGESLNFHSQATDSLSNKKDNENLMNKEINFKLKKLKVSLYKNAKYDKKSACFWCTYEYDNPSCYIPKYENDKSIVGYGSFCTPECACSHLMKENLDDSTKFERYHLLNKTYGKAYNYNKNIKPAPDPFYLLDKYYGNMTIQEYRKLLKSERTLIVLEKPFTRFLPELHEDNEEIMLNCNNREMMENNSKKTDEKNKHLNSYDKFYENNTLKNNNSVSVGNPPGTYKVKRQTDKVDEMSKTNIMKKLFT